MQQVLVVAVGQVDQDGLALSDADGHRVHEVPILHGHDLVLEVYQVDVARVVLHAELLLEAALEVVNLGLYTPARSIVPEVHLQSPESEQTITTVWLHEE